MERLRTAVGVGLEPKENWTSAGVGGGHVSLSALCSNHLWKVFLSIFNPIIFIWKQVEIVSCWLHSDCQINHN